MILIVFIFIVIATGIVGATLYNQVKYINSSIKPITKDLTSKMSHSHKYFIYPINHDKSLSDTLDSTSGVEVTRVNSEDEEEPIYKLTIDGMNVFYDEYDAVVLDNERYSEFKFIIENENKHITNPTKDKFMIYYPVPNKFFMLDLTEMKSVEDYDNSKVTFEISPKST